MYDDASRVDIKRIKHAYNSSLPENKDVQIIPIVRDEYCSFDGLTSIENKKGDYYRYGIEISANKKKKRMHVSDIPFLMHESTHVLDYLLNPKTIISVKKMEEKDIFQKDYYDLFTNCFYPKEGIPASQKDEKLAEIDAKMREMLSEVPFDEKITFLNYIKHNLEMEHHAYEQENKFANILLKRDQLVWEECLDNWNKYLYFPEKIEIINKYLAEEIAKERAKPKAKD